VVVYKYLSVSKYMFLVYPRRGELLVELSGVPVISVSVPPRGLA